MILCLSYTFSTKLHANLNQNPLEDFSKAQTETRSNLKVSESKKLDTDVKINSKISLSSQISEKSGESTYSQVSQ